MMTNFVSLQLFLPWFLRDDVADHERWSEQLGCPRILHAEEVWNLQTWKDSYEMRKLPHLQL